ncbi:TIGR01621 family pseudouridine synthase [Aestuariirhabdus sp. Z084]|uniref:TIGR01621 family pseudouridine synthase n=1 Tax=Aestuariirhabdus haliotis TaxID=2918751 RepID=UPI00201B404B|nr:TIGR01621 family pseudouridine synthase [Aestuariirhabdus haliotis]MCL6416925.1 TIGR01621 family pseudouridine synthase [Aestuariirhabdus haliotis]MCL6420913.1 TIGR01621 family pseudouridine synthase [Aestuariirhabdus haliotis]
MPQPWYQLVHQHDDFLLIDKAAGISVHRDDEAEGLVARIAREQGEAQLFLVHRLDRMTSGLLLLARNPDAAAGLAELFREHRIEKFYLALSARKPNRKQGLIRGDMTRSRRGSWKLGKSTNNPALTQFFSTSIEHKRRLFILRPATGKTHQIRVAMKSLAAPILGDARYGDQAQAQACDRGYLHAYALRFQWRDESLEFVRSPGEGVEYLTDECQQQIEQWNTPWELPWPELKQRGRV